jgi:hypothetical protein
MRKFVYTAGSIRRKLLWKDGLWLPVLALLALGLTVPAQRAWAEGDAEKAEKAEEVEEVGGEGDDAKDGEEESGEEGGAMGRGVGRGERAVDGGGGEEGEGARGRGRGERGGERGESGEFSNLSDEQRERVRRAMGEVWQREDVRRARQLTEEANRKLREVLRQAMEEADPALSEIMPQIAPEPRRGGERGRGSEGGAMAGPAGPRGGMWTWPPGELMVGLERAQQGRLMQAHEKVMAESEVKEAREALERLEGEQAKERARLREAFVRAYLAQVKELLPDLLPVEE